MVTVKGILPNLVKIEKNDFILMGAGFLGLILHITGICSLHWIECQEWWKLKDAVRKKCFFSYFLFLLKLSKIVTK